MEMQNFLFKQDLPGTCHLPPAHSAKTTNDWFADHNITVLDGPANIPDLNLTENLWFCQKKD